MRRPCACAAVCPCGGGCSPAVWMADGSQMHGTRSGWSTPGGSRVCACSEMARVRTSVVARASLLLHLARNRVYQDPCGDGARMCGKPCMPADRSQLSAAGAVQSDLERSRLARAARSESSSTCGLAVVLTPTRHRTITNARKTTQIDAPAPSSPVPPRWHPPRARTVRLTSTRKQLRASRTRVPGGEGGVSYSGFERSVP
jgi:hypothetical protein